MTTVIYEPDKYRICVNGHAQSEGWWDPVCAGASALAWTLVEAATDKADYHVGLNIDQNKAIIDVWCSPTEEEKENCRYLYEIIIGGLQLIAEACPENMQIKIGG